MYALFVILFLLALNQGWRTMNVMKNRFEVQVVSSASVCASVFPFGWNNSNDWSVSFPFPKNKFLFHGFLDSWTYPNFAALFFKSLLNFSKSYRLFNGFAHSSTFSRQSIQCPEIWNSGSIDALPVATFHTSTSPQQLGDFLIPSFFNFQSLITRFGVQTSSGFDAIFPNRISNFYKNHADWAFDHSVSATIHFFLPRVSFSHLFPQGYSKR
jgi:hypothetical protein